MMIFPFDLRYRECNAEVIACVERLLGTGKNFWIEFQDFLSLTRYGWKTRRRIGGSCGRSRRAGCMVFAEQEFGNFNASRLTDAGGGDCIEGI
jgi:hypothetical protein